MAQAAGDQFDHFDEPEKPENGDDAEKRSTTGGIPELMAGTSVDPALARRTGEVIRRYSGGLRRWFVGHAVVSLIGTVGQLVLPGVVGLAIDQAVTGRGGSGLAMLVGALIAVSLSAALTEPLLTRFTAGVVARGTRDLLDHTLLLATGSEVSTRSSIRRWAACRRANVS